MTYNEYWLLEAAATGGVPVDWIKRSPKSLQEQFNRRPPIMDADTAIDLLHRLIHEEFVVLIDSHVCESQDELQDIVRRGGEKVSRSQLNDIAWSQRTYKGCGGQYYYALTPQGGAYWESIARPDWDSFWDYKYLDDSGDRVTKIEVVSRNDEFIHSLMSVRPLIAGTRLFPHTAQQMILPTWDATYWKVLNDAVSLSGDWDKTLSATDMFEIERNLVLRPEVFAMLHRGQDAWHQGFRE